MHHIDGGAVDGTGVGGGVRALDGGSATATATAIAAGGAGRVRAVFVRESATIAAGGFGAVAVVSVIFMARTMKSRKKHEI